MKFFNKQTKYLLLLLLLVISEVHVIQSKVSRKFQFRKRFKKNSKTRSYKAKKAEPKIDLSIKGVLNTFFHPAYYGRIYDKQNFQGNITYCKTREEFQAKFLKKHSELRIKLKELEEKSFKGDISEFYFSLDVMPDKKIILKNTKVRLLLTKEIIKRAENAENLLKNKIEGNEIDKHLLDLSDIVDIEETSIASFNEKIFKNFGEIEILEEGEAAFYYSHFDYLPFLKAGLVYARYNNEQLQEKLKSDQLRLPSAVVLGRNTFMEIKFKGKELQRVFNTKEYVNLSRKLEQLESIEILGNADKEKSF